MSKTPPSGRSCREIRMTLSQALVLAASTLFTTPLFGQSYARPHYDFMSILGGVSSTAPPSVGAAQGMCYLKGADGNHPGYWQPKPNLEAADSMMTRKVFEVDGELSPSGGGSESASPNLPPGPGGDIDPSKLQHMSQAEQMAFAQQYMAKAMAAQQSMSKPMIEDPKVVPVISIADSLSVVLAKLSFTYSHGFDSVAIPAGTKLHKTDSIYNVTSSNLAAREWKASGAERTELQNQQKQLTKQWKADRVRIEGDFLSAEGNYLGEFREKLGPILNKVDQIEDKLHDGKDIKIAPSGAIYKGLLTNAMKNIAIVQDTPLELVQDALPFMEVPQPQSSQQQDSPGGSSPGGSSSGEGSGD